MHLVELRRMCIRVCRPDVRTVPHRPPNITLILGPLSSSPASSLPRLAHRIVAFKRLKLPVYFFLPAYVVHWLVE